MCVLQNDIYVYVYMCQGLQCIKLCNFVLHSYIVTRCVLQNDIHAPGTTVYEALEFSAQMRILDVDKHKLKAFVDQVSCIVCQLCQVIFQCSEMYKNAVRWSLGFA